MTRSEKLLIISVAVNGAALVAWVFVFFKVIL